MKNLILKLRQEHQQILKMLTDKCDIQEIIHFVETVHHPLEEQELFPAMAQSPLLRQGGPLCTFFMGMDLELNPNQPARDHLQDLYSKGFPLPPPYQDYSWLKPQNPLSVPMDEHVLGHNIAEALKHLAHPQHQAEFPGALEILCRDYETLLRQHIDKEDRCLFVLGERMFS